MDILLICGGWYAIGVWGFIYWWTKDYDIELHELYMPFFVGIVGPIAWLGGWYIHGKPSTKVIFKKKNQSK